MSRVLEDYRPVCGRARMSGKIGISALVFLGLACSSVFGQAVSQISGTVADSSGAAIPDVQITATQTATGTATNCHQRRIGHLCVDESPDRPIPNRRHETRFPQLHPDRNRIAGR